MCLLIILNDKSGLLSSCFLYVPGIHYEFFYFSSILMFLTYSVAAHPNEFNQFMQILRVITRSQLERSRMPGTADVLIPEDAIQAWE